MTATQLKPATSRLQRTAALTDFISVAPSIGVTDAWLVGSMAAGRDTDLSDVNLVIDGGYIDADVRRLVERIRRQTGVSVTCRGAPYSKPCVKVL